MIDTSSESTAIEVQQHIAWVRVYAETMTSSDWRDMALRIARQLDGLEEAVKALTKDRSMTDADLKRALDDAPWVIKDEHVPLATRDMARALLAEHARAERLAEEKEIVSRIWKMFGNPSYEQLAGRSIYDLIAELQAKAAALEADVATLRGALKSCEGYLLNAAIDIETGPAKRTAISTIEGGIRMVRAALSTTQGAKATADGDGNE